MVDVSSEADPHGVVVDVAQVEAGRRGARVGIGGRDADWSDVETRIR
jgi:hypothetical protein